MKHVKFPRIPHLPWSPGISSDDKVHHTLDHFIGKRIITTEKFDGANFTLYRDGLHGRSLDGRYHISQAWIRNFHAKIKHEIPENYRICGEYLYAKHSILYTRLPDFFLVFAVFRDTTCLSWEYTTQFCLDYGFSMVPTIYTGLWDEDDIKESSSYDSFGGGEQEGYVVRLADEFPDYAYSHYTAKYVRPNHNQTDRQWKIKTLTPNRLM